MPLIVQRHVLIAHLYIHVTVGWNHRENEPVYVPVLLAMVKNVTYEQFNDTQVSLTPQISSLIRTAHLTSLALNTPLIIPTAALRTPPITPMHMAALRTPLITPTPALRVSPSPLISLITTTTRILPTTHMMTLFLVILIQLLILYSTKFLLS